MADVAKIGIVVDATGAQREIKVTTEELKRLANGGKEAQAVMRNLTPPAAVVEMQKTAQVITQVRQAQQGSTVSADKLRGAFTSLAIASGALPGPLGRIGSILGSFALGSGVMIGVLAGIAALGFAWEKLTEKSRLAREEFERQLDVLRKLKREQDLGVLGEAGDATGAGRARLTRISGAMQATNALMKSGQITGPAFATLATRRAALIEEYQALEPLVLAGERRVAEIREEEAKKSSEEQKRIAAERERSEQEAFNRRIAFIKQQHEMEQALFPERFGRTSTSSPLGPLGGDLSAQNSAEFFEQQGNDLRFNVLPALQEYLQKMKEAADEAERIAKAAQEQKDALILGAGIGVMSGIASRMGGPFGGAASGLISGISGGPIGMATGAFSGFVSALFDMGNSAKRQREEMEALKRQHDAFTDSIKEQLGLMSPLEVRIREVTRQFADARDRFEEFAEGTNGILNDIFNPTRTEEARRNIAELTRLERDYIELLRQQAAQRASDIQQESEILRLRIDGNDEMADAMQRQIDKQKELRDALEAGATQAEITAIKEKQRLQDILQAVERTQEKIAAFAATISNLQTFRNALVLSDDAGRSDTERLAEARRQYEAVLGRAMGGDQSAAGQLPGAAQAFIQFSRLVNASGQNFEDDFKKVLRDTADVIAKFQDLKTIEELMLDELRKIAEDTGTLSGRGASPPTDSPDRPWGRLIEVTQSGLVEVRNELRVLQQRVEEQTGVNRQGFDGFITNTLN